MFREMKKTLFVILIALSGCSSPNQKYASIDLMPQKEINSFTNARKADVKKIVGLPTASHCSPDSKTWIYRGTNVSVTLVFGSDNRVSKLSFSQTPEYSRKRLAERLGSIDPTLTNDDIDKMLRRKGIGPSSEPDSE